MVENENVPRIRFEGFTDPWEQRKLGKVFEEYSDKGHPELPALTIIQGGGTVRRDESNRNLQFDASGLANYKMVNKGDFIVHLRSFEGGLEKATLQGLVSPAYHTFRSEEAVSDFYRLYFRSNRFINTDLKPHVYGIRDGRSIDIEGMATVLIPWTDIKEQEQIGDYFRQLDSLITLHQRKYEKLQKLKKSMLDKMFPKPGELYPEIRFEGFTDPWEQRKLSEVVDVYGGRDYKHLEKGQIPVYGTGGLMAGVSEALSYDKDAVGIGRKGTIDKPYLLKAPFWTVDTLFYSIPRADVDLGFAFCSFLTVDWKSKDESTGLPSLSKEAINETPLRLPNSVEQKYIGAFFSRIDAIITLHQRKRKQYTTSKTLVWEQRKLGDVVGAVYGGGTPDTACAEYWNGSIPWIQSSNVTEGKLFEVNIPKAITEEGLSNSAATRVPENSIAVVTHVGVGKLSYLPFSYATSQDFVSLSALKGSPLYLCYALYGKLQSELNMVQGSAIKGITKDELLGKGIACPSIEEQESIGRGLQAIDSLITLHQREP